jgi:hypothetical protein
MVIWNILRSFGIFYGHLEYFTVIWYILWTFGNVVVIWYIFPSFWYIVSRKIWQPSRPIDEKPSKTFFSENKICRAAGDWSYGS